MYPNDLLYENILADAYFEEGRFDEAQRLFTDNIWRDEQNRNIREISKLSHRAFCRECFSQIIGTREKCTSEDCRSYDWCTTCIKAARDTCAHERRIQIPGNIVQGLKIIWETRAGGVQYKRVAKKIPQ